MWACAFTLGGLSYNLTALPPLRARAGGATYVLDACRDVAAAAADPRGSCSGAAAPAWQYRGDFCYALGARAPAPRVAALPGGSLGAAVTFSGGAVCANGVARSSSLFFECAAAPAAVTASEPAPCAYELRVAHPAACPAECPRDGARGDEPCGGATRGACVAAADGGASCACIGGASGAACEIGGASATPRGGGRSSVSGAPPPSAPLSLSIEPAQLGAPIGALAAAAVGAFFLYECTRSAPSVDGACARRTRAALIAAALVCAAALGAVLAGGAGDAAAPLAPPVSVAPWKADHPIGASLCIGDAQREHGGSGSGGGRLRAPGAAGAAAAPADLARVADRFSEIYEKDLWSADGGGSGMGSSLEQTGTLRLIIELVAYRYAAATFLDAPCGSAFWWPPVLAAIRAHIPCFALHGVDVAPLAIERARERHAGDASATFAIGDVSTAPLPAGADVVLCRDALQHLPLALAVRVLRNIAAARPRFLLVGSYVTEHANARVPVGDYYPVNVRDPPFSFPPPIDDFDERTPVVGQANKHLLLYSREQLDALDFAAMLAAAEA